MSDFKQAVEEILHHCDKEEKCGWPYCDSCDYRVDRILAAHNAELDRIADSLPHCKLEEYDFFDVNINNATKVQLNADQDYVRAQKEEM
jgi:hypothetical protein